MRSQIASVYASLVESVCHSSLDPLRARLESLARVERLYILAQYGNDILTATELVQDEEQDLIEQIVGAIAVLDEIETPASNRDLILRHLMRLKYRIDGIPPRPLIILQIKDLVASAAMATPTMLSDIDLRGITSDTLMCEMTFNILRKDLSAAANIFRWHTILLQCDFLQLDQNDMRLIECAEAAIVHWGSGDAYIQYQLNVAKSRWG